MKRTLVTLTGCILAVAASADTRSSANYALTTETHESGGRVTSANYTIDVGMGASAGGLSLVSVPAETLKSGYIGQLYDIVALAVSAPPSTNLNETASRQLVAAPQADDTTTLATLDPSTVAWSIVSGPIASISSSGLATAGNVYQDTAATVGGTAQSLSGQFNLTILNVTTDDFGTYAGDQIDDSWQVQYFGQPPNPNAGPNADPDGDGQVNLFEFTAGLVPTDPNSRFVLAIQPVIGQTAQKNIVFNPLVGGRTYGVQFRTNLATGTWDPLTGTTQSDNGNQRTVTDTSAAAPKYYRVQISKP